MKVLAMFSGCNNNNNSSSTFQKSKDALQWVDGCRRGHLLFHSTDMTTSRPVAAVTFSGMNKLRFHSGTLCIWLELVQILLAHTHTLTYLYTLNYEHKSCAYTLTKNKHTHLCTLFTCSLSLKPIGGSASKKSNPNSPIKQSHEHAGAVYITVAVVCITQG